MTGILALFLAVAAQSIAASNEWNTLGADCSSELQTQWDPKVKAGAEWEVKSLQNVGDLTVLLSKVCPDYSRRPNDPDAIAAFQQAKSKSLDRAPPLEKEGKSLLHFLDGIVQEHTMLFYPTEMDFRASRCGRRLQHLTEQTRARLSAINILVKKVERACLGSVGKSDGKAAGTVVAPVHSAPVTQKIPTPAAGIDRRGSDISGTEEKKKP